MEYEISIENLQEKYVFMYPRLATTTVHMSLYMIYSTALYFNHNSLSAQS